MRSKKALMNSPLMANVPSLRSPDVVESFYAGVGGHFAPGDEVRIEACGAYFSPEDLIRLWVVMSPRYTDNVLIGRKDALGKWTATLSVRRENLRHTTLLDMLASIDGSDVTNQVRTSGCRRRSGLSDAARQEHH